MRKINVILYSLTKYIELGLMALVLLHFAKNSGPQVYGELSLSLVLISYSAFSVLGINASYVKFFSISNSGIEKRRLTAFCFWYNCIIGLIVFVIIILSVNDIVSVSLATICCLNLARGSVQSILRAKLKVGLLSIFNVTFSLLYIGFYYYGVTLLESYSTDIFLKNWSNALISISILGFLFLYRELLDITSYSFAFIRNIFKKLISDSILLFIVNFGNMLILSSDRLLLNLMGVSKESVGYYQFAENIAAIFYLGSSAILYLLTPFYMRKLSQGVITINSFKVLSEKVALFWIAPLILFILASSIIVDFIFSDYQNAIPLIIGLSIIKYFCLMLFVPITVLSTFHKEILLVRKYFITIIFMLILQFIFIEFYIKSLMYLPLIGFVSVIFLLLSLWGCCQDELLSNENIVSENT